MQVLIVEPDKMLARAYQLACTQAGMAVQIAHTAQTAVAAADQATPDVVVLELQMPRHNGLEFLYEFKSYPEWQHIPVILLSSVAVEVLTKQTMLAQELSVVSILQKAHTTSAELCHEIQKAVAATT